MAQVNEPELAQGDSVAEAAPTFEEFFEGERRRLFRALFLITGNTHEAEEITQDAFLKVWERWERVREMDNPAGYLYRTALNGSRSRYRRLLRAAKETVVAGQAEDPFAAADTRDEVVRAIRALAPRQRAAIVLTELLDHSSEEASRLLGVKPATIRNLAFQARAALKEAMVKNDE